MSAPFFDLQVNGFAGVDFQQDSLTGTQLEIAMQGLVRHGTGGILLTLITDTIDKLCQRLLRIEQLKKECPLAQQIIKGIHIEGPWLLPEVGYHGAHLPQLMSDPSARDFDKLWAASGENIKLITLAPELPGSAETISHAASHGVRTAIGHSNASDKEIDDAIEAGLTLCTHLGNGVPAQLHRHDNVIQRLLARDELTAVFIPDGIHLPATVLQNYVRAKPQGKVLFTTDCMAASGAGPGRYTLAHVQAEVGSDGVVREEGKDNFAGSSLTMDQAEKNIRSFLGWSAEESLAACSSGVKEALGLT